jgi:Fur family transcriptional regulator, ferric uptake regulator
MEQQQQIISILKQHRLRLTRTRRALLELFVRESTPLSVPKILCELAKRSVAVNKTTVYRELETLERIGIVQGAIFQNRKQYYELAARGQHHHFICTICSKITDVEINGSAVLASAEHIGRTAGFHVASYAVAFYGQCAACLKTLLFHRSV